MNRKVVVILANLGGPNKKGDVRQFLFNLFNDKYIIPLPKIPRFLLALLISTLRAKKSQKEYDRMGGFSPILQNTIIQRDALQKILGDSFDVKIAMSYSRPNMNDAFNGIDKDVEKVILLPLYPQFSITTTKSSAAKFCRTASRFNIQNIDVIPNFFENKLYIESCVNKIIDALTNLKDAHRRTIVLFSAHGIPKDFVVKYSDPYQQQIEKTAELIMQGICSKGFAEKDIESMVCFQSRVGPKEWLKPYIQSVLPQFMGCNVVVFPIAFVSEHLETLIELDHQYKEFAHKCGVFQYVRVGTPSSCPVFIEALKHEVLKKV